jgi:ankyrin repeat protein
MGKSKVFIRGTSYESLELLRNKKIVHAVTTIQATFRMFSQRIEYEISVYAIKLIQKFVRQIGAHRRMNLLRKYHALTVIQRSFRCYRARSWLNAAKRIAIWLQSAHRGAVARQYCAFLFLDEKASIIQKLWRRHSKTSFSSFRSLRKSTVTLQNRYRCRKATRLLWQLRKEAKDLALVAAERDQFKEESRRLRLELETARKKAKEVPPKPPVMPEEVERLRSEVQNLQSKLEKAQELSSPTKSAVEESKSLADALHRKEEELKRLRREVASLRLQDERPASVKSVIVDLVDYRNRDSTSFHKSPRHCASPARSDVSLLDHEIDDKMEDDVSSLTSFVHHESGGDELRQLHAAIRKRGLKHIDRVLNDTSEACVLVNQGDQYGRTAIHLAALSQDTEIAGKLIEKGAVVNAQDDDGETPLHLAENSKMISFLLREGKANPNIPNVDGICALHLAVQRRDLDSVRALVTNNANVNNADNIRWFTALHLIALASAKDSSKDKAVDNRCRIAGLLTGDFGNTAADLNYQDIEGNSPLHYAVQLEQSDTAELVKLFLQKEADPNLRNGRDQAPLHLLCHNDKLRRYTSVYRDSIGSLLTHGADPSLQSLTGCTPLHLCLFHRDIDTAVQLVQAGAQLHSPWKKVSPACLTKTIDTDKISSAICH